MHYEDLTLCEYHRGPHDASEWHSPLRAIGWLEHPHDFSSGQTTPELLARLELLIAASWDHYPSEAFRGRHECTLCLLGDARPSRPVRSHENIWVPGDGVVYIAPGMITHYVGDHGYRPPTEFIDAVMNCPDYGSPAYCSALRAANADHAPPLLTKAEVEAHFRALYARGGA